MTPALADLQPFRVVGLLEVQGVLVVDWAIELSPYSTAYVSVLWLGLS